MIAMKDLDINGLILPNDDFKNKKDYKKRLRQWQRKLLQIQQAYYNSGRRAILVFEGVDAGGKGGAIRRLTEALDPRGFRVHAIAKPDPAEQALHYLYRFFQRLPPPGCISIFDRSWYGRVLVERVEGFASPNEWQRAFQEINEFERWLADDGVRVIKFYFQVDKAEQNKRFEERLTNPAKHWKITEEDIRNRLKWDEYIVAANEMLSQTSQQHAPWYAVQANHKWATRLFVAQTVANYMAQDMDIEPLALDPELDETARAALGL